MKTILLFILISLISLSSVAQNNPPLVVDDYESISERWRWYSKSFSNKIDVVANDTDPDVGQILTLDSIYTNSPRLKPQIVLNSIYFLSQSIILNENGIFSDTIYYRVTDNGTPNLSSWGKLIINITKTNASYQDSFYNGNINAILNSYGCNFLDFNNGLPGFYVPKTGKVSTIYAQNFGLVGIKSNGDTVASNYYFDSQISSNLYPGPYKNKKYSISDELKWNKIWRITDWDIQQHKLNFNKQGYQIKQIFLDWPAHGDTSLGHSYYLAPFVDVNNNGKYEPLLGDYPKIKGQIAYYTIQSQSLLIDTAFWLEKHAMYYGYNCINDEIYNTLFVDVNIYNRGNSNMKDCYFVSFTDYDIGCSNNDYIGCDVEGNFSYGYNGIIPDNNCNGSYGYGYQNVIQSLTILKGAKLDDDNMDNPFGPYFNQNQSINGIGFGDGILDNEYWGMNYFNGFFNLSYPKQSYYKVATGWINDSVRMLCDTTNIPCRYHFSRYSDTTYYYGTNGVKIRPSSEQFVNNPPDDRRSLVSTGPFSLNKNEKINVELAFTTTLTNDTSILGSLPLMEQYVDSLHSYYRRNKLPCGGNFTNVQEYDYLQQPFNVVVYPNPTKGRLFISYDSEKSAQAVLYDIYGKQIFATQISEGLNELNVRDIANGIYFLRLSNIQAKKVVKIVKQ